MLFRMLTIIFATLVIAGCGGGGATGQQEPFSLDVTQTKTFLFSWAPIEGATQYNILENPDGSSGFSVIASLDGESLSYRHRVFLPERFNASYILEACVDINCESVHQINVDSDLSLAIGYFKSTTPNQLDRYGVSIALSSDGSLMAVGAPYRQQLDAQADNYRKGAVYIYEMSPDGDWSFIQELQPQSAFKQVNFGAQVAFSSDGSRLAVSQPARGRTTPGIVLIYDRSGDLWQETAQLSASNPNASDFFGAAMAMSSDGKWIVIGAELEDGSGTGINPLGTDSMPDAGAAYIFENDNGWHQRAYVKASNTSLSANFGASAAISAVGDTIAIGAPMESSTAVNSGAVYVFKRSGSIWEEVAFLQPSNADAQDEFGKRLALSGNGTVLIASADDESGSSTGIDGNQLDNSMSESGAVYVFEDIEGTWAQQSYVKASNTEEGDLFGNSVSISANGESFAVGAIFESSAASGVNGSQLSNARQWSGATYLFRKQDNSWQQTAYIKAPNPQVSALSGSAVVLSDDGKTLAVAAPLEDGGSTGVNGPFNGRAVDSGAVYLY